MRIYCMVYKIFRKLETGELLMLASSDNLDQAKQLVESLNEHWPGDYSVQDSTSQADIDLDW